MASAVADYAPVKKSKVKIKKAKGELAVRLKSTVDILAWAGKHKNQQRATSHKLRFIVGFALEDRNLRKSAEKKLKEKKLDMIIANDCSSIGADEVSVQVKTTGGEWRTLPRAGKVTVARRIIALIERGG